MTLLLMEQYDDEAVLVTDTLTVGAEDRPAAFRSKVWTLPHMNMVIALTGSAMIGDVWYNHIVTAAGATNIDELDALAPESLRRIQADVEEHNKQECGPSTVYHFGFPPGSDKLVRYTYRSRNGYEAERFAGNQFGAKPIPPDYPLQQPEGAEETIRLAYELRDLCRFDSGELMIGGELFATRITDWNIQTMRWHRFPDYDDTLNTMRSTANEGATHV